MLKVKVLAAAFATALISFGCATDNSGRASTGDGHSGASTTPTTTTGSHDVGGSGREHVTGTPSGQYGSGSGGATGSSAGGHAGGAVSPTTTTGSHDVGGSGREHVTGTPSGQSGTGSAGGIGTEGGPTTATGSHDVGGSDQRHIHR